MTPSRHGFSLAAAIALLVLVLATGPAVAGRDGAFLGITSSGLSGEEARKAGLSSRDGVILHTVYPGTAAEQAGLRAGDILIAFGDQKIFDDRDLTDMILEREPGDRVTITLIRDGQNMSVDAVLGTRDDLGSEDYHDGWSRFWDGISELFHGRSGGDGPRLGVYIEELGDQMADYFEVDEGVLITQIVRESAAERAGLLAGDVVTRVGDDTIRGSGDISRALRGRFGETVTVTVVRKGQRREVPVALEED